MKSLRPNCRIFFDKPSLSFHFVFHPVRSSYSFKWEVFFSLSFLSSVGLTNKWVSPKRRPSFISWRAGWEPCLWSCWCILFRSKFSSSAWLFALYCSTTFPFPVFHFSWLLLVFFHAHILCYCWFLPLTYTQWRFTFFFLWRSLSLCSILVFLPLLVTTLLSCRVSWGIAFALRSDISLPYLLFHFPFTDLVFPGQYRHPLSLPRHHVRTTYTSPSPPLLQRGVFAWGNRRDQKRQETGRHSSCPDTSQGEQENRTGGEGDEFQSTDITGRGRRCGGRYGPVSSYTREPAAEAGFSGSVFFLYIYMRFTCFV